MKKTALCAVFCSFPHLFTTFVVKKFVAFNLYRYTKEIERLIIIFFIHNVFY